MKTSTLCGVAAIALCASLPDIAQTAPPTTPAITAPMSPSEVVASADSEEWQAIAPSDLLIMTLAPDPRGGAGRSGERRVIIQLLPAPFSQGWVGNIRQLATAQWWDGLAIVRTQDNYVVQWGDPDGEDATKARALPVGLQMMTEGGYAVDAQVLTQPLDPYASAAPNFVGGGNDPYGRSEFYAGWPVASSFVGSGLSARNSVWPVHCYGMVGVGRGLSPDAGTGAELYTVIGHAPRHLDRNIALVGRVIEGIQHLSSLQRGTGPLGFYETAEERTGIASIRLASDLPEGEHPRFEYLSTESQSFARYAEARANRRDAFFIVPAGGADICNVPVPVRRVP